MSLCSYQKIRFGLSRLWMPIEPIVYDSKFNPGDTTGYYERYLVTREIKGYRLWHISFVISETLKIRKLELFDNKSFAQAVAQAAVSDKLFIADK